MSAAPTVCLTVILNEILKANLPEVKLDKLKSTDRVVGIVINPIAKAVYIAAKKCEDQIVEIDKQGQRLSKKLMREAKLKKLELAPTSELLKLDSEFKHASNKRSCLLKLFCLMVEEDLGRQVFGKTIAVREDWKIIIAKDTQSERSEEGFVVFTFPYFAVR